MSAHNEETEYLKLIVDASVGDLSPLNNIVDLFKTLAKTVRDFNPQINEFQTYWKSQADMISSASNAVEEYNRSIKENKNVYGSASNLVKSTQSLIARAMLDGESDIGTYLESNVKGLRAAFESALKVDGILDIKKAFDVDSLKEVFSVFKALESEHFSVQEIFGKLNKTVDYDNLASSLEASRKTVSELHAELAAVTAERDRLKTSGDVFGLTELEGKLTAFKNDAKAAVESFLTINNIGKDNSVVQEVFAAIENGTMTSSAALKRLNKEFEYLLNKSFSGGSINTTFFDSLLSTLTRIESSIQAITHPQGSAASGSTGVVDKIASTLSGDTGKEAALTAGLIADSIGRIGTNSGTAYNDSSMFIDKLKELVGMPVDNLRMAAGALQSMSSIKNIGFSSQSFENLKGLVDWAGKSEEALNKASASLSKVSLKNFEDLSIKSTSLKNLSVYLPQIADPTLISNLNKLSSIKFDNLNSLSIRKGNINGIDSLVKSSQELGKSFGEGLRGALSAEISKAVSEMRSQLEAAAKSFNGSVGGASAAGGGSSSSGESSSTKGSVSTSLYSKTLKAKYDAATSLLGAEKGTRRYDALEKEFIRLSQAVEAEADALKKRGVNVKEDARLIEEEKELAFKYTEAKAKRADAQAAANERERVLAENELQKERDAFSKRLALRKEEIESEVNAWTAASQNQSTYAAYTGLFNIGVKENDGFDWIQRSLDNGTITLEKAIQHFEFLNQRAVQFEETIRSLGMDQSLEKMNEKLVSGTDEFQKAFDQITKFINTTSTDVSKWSAAEKSGIQSVSDAYKNLQSVIMDAIAIRDALLSGSLSQNEFSQWMASLTSDRRNNSNTIIANDLDYSVLAKGTSEYNSAAEKLNNAIVKLIDARNKLGARIIDDERGTNQGAIEYNQHIKETINSYIDLIREMTSLKAGLEGMNSVDASARIEELVGKMKELFFETERANKEQRLLIAGTTEYNDAQTKVNSLLASITKHQTDWTAAAHGATKNEYAKYADLIKELKYLLTQMNGMPADEFSRKLKDLANQAKNVDASIRMAGKSTKSFGDRVKDVMTRFSAYFSGYSIIMRVVRAIKQMINVVKELDDAEAQLQIVTRAANSMMAENTKQIMQYSKETASAVKDMYSSQTTYARLGYSLDASAELAKYTAMLKNVGDIDVADAQDAITAIIKAFDIDTDDIETVMDKLVVVGNNFPISVSQLATGMNDAGSVLASAGNSFEESLALLAAANTTVQNISKSATGLRTIAARLRNTKTELDDLGEAITTAEYGEMVSALTKYNVALTDSNGELRSTYDVMNDIAAVWNQMTKNEQAALSELASGTRQQNIFYSLIEQFQEASGAMKAMESSEGELSKANDIYLNTITGKVAEFKAALASLSQDLFSSELIGFFVKFGTTVISIIDGVIKLTNHLGGLKNVLGGLGLGLVIRNINSIIKKANGAMLAIWTLFRKIQVSAMNATTSAEKLSAVFSSFGKDMSAAQLAATKIGLVIIAITALVAISKKLSDRQKEIHEKAEQLISDVEKINSDIEETKEQISANIKAIDDIYSAAEGRSLTFVEQDEVDRLRESNALLELEIANYRILAEETSKEANKKLEKSFNKIRYSVSDKTTDSGTISHSGITAEQQKIQDDIYWYQHFVDQFNKAVADGDLKYAEQMQKRADEFRSALAEEFRMIDEDYLSQYTGESEFTDAWSQMLEDIAMVISPVEYLQNKLDSLSTSAKGYIEILSKDGELTAEEVKDVANSYSDFAGILALFGGNAEAVAGYYNAMRSGSDGVAESAQDAAEEVEKLKDVFSDISTLRGLSKTGAKENSNGGLSESTISSIIGAISEDDKVSVTDFLYEENGAVKFNTKAWDDYAKSKENALIATAQSQIASLRAEIDVLTGEGSAVPESQIAKKVAEITDKIKENESEIQFWESLLNAIGVTIETTADRLSKLNDYLSDAVSEADTVRDSVKDMNDALLDMADGESLSADQVISLVETYPMLANEITKTTDGYTLNKDALEKLRDLELAAEKERIDSAIRVAKAQISSSGAVTKAYASQIKGIATLAEAEQVYEKFNSTKLGGIDPERIAEIDEENYRVLYNGIWTQLSGADAINTLKENIQVNNTLKKLEQLYAQVELLDTISPEDYISGGGRSDSEKDKEKETEEYIAEIEKFRKELYDLSNAERTVADSERDLDRVEGKWVDKLIDPDVSKSLKERIDTLGATIKAVEDFKQSMSELSDDGLDASQIREIGATALSKLSETSKSIGLSAEEAIASYDNLIEEYHDAQIAYAEAGRTYNSEYRQRIVIEKELLDLYKSQQDAQHGLNEARDAYINQSADKLRSLGFDVIYDSENNEFFVNNLEHINDLVASSVGEYDNLQEATNAYRKEIEELINECETLNDENEEGSQSWLIIQDEISKTQKQIIEDLKNIVVQSHEYVDAIQNVYDTLQAAADEFSENGGFISVDTFQSILGLGPEYMQYLKDQNGMLVINREKIEDVIKAKTESLALDQAMTYVERIEAAMQKGAVEDLNNLLFATTALTDATWDLVYAKLESLDLDDNQYAAAKHNIDAIKNLMNTTISGIGNVAASYSEQLEHTKDGLDDILEYVKKMLQDINEREIEALEDQKEAFGEIIDLRKELLKDAADEEDYEEGIAERTQEIAELQVKINQLMLDDSREAQAKRIELEKEMAEKQKDLSKDQRDHAIELTEEQLDDTKEAYDKEKDAEIEILQNKYSSEQKLHDAAIQYIQDHYDTLYGELMDWNYEYGSDLQTKIQSAWDSCNTAVQLYGSYLEAVKQTTQEIANIGGSVDWSYGEDGTKGDSYGKPVQHDVVGADGNPTDIYSAGEDAAVGKLVYRMYQNSLDWAATDDADVRSALHEDNERIHEELTGLGINAVYDSKSGIWYVDKIGGEKLYEKYKKYFPKFHDGGVVGDIADRNQEEVLALLKKGEAVLTERQETGLYKVVDFFSVMSEKLGKVIDGDLFSKIAGGTMTGFKYRDNQFYGNTSNGGIHVDRVEVTAPIQIVQKLDDAEIQRCSKTIGSIAAGFIQEGFSKRGLKPGSSLL